MGGNKIKISEVVIMIIIMFYLSSQALSVQAESKSVPKNDCLSACIVECISHGPRLDPFPCSTRCAEQCRKTPPTNLAHHCFTACAFTKSMEMVNNDIRDVAAATADHCVRECQNI